MATGVIGGFTNSVGQDVHEFPDYYRETRDGPQILYLHVLHDFGWLKQEPRNHLHTNPRDWRTDKRGRVTCKLCGGFIGYKSFERTAEK